MAIHAIDLHRVARFAIEIAVAMVVLLEVAVGAVHPFLQMDVAQLHGAFRSLRPVGSGRCIRVQQVALAVALVYSAEHPAMAVKIAQIAGVFQSC